MKPEFDWTQWFIKVATVWIAAILVIITLAGCTTIQPQPKCAHLNISTGEWSEVDCSTLEARIKADELLNGIDILHE